MIRAEGLVSLHICSGLRGSYPGMGGCSRQRPKRPPNIRSQHFGSEFAAQAEDAIARGSHDLWDPNASVVGPLFGQGANPMRPPCTGG